MFIKQILKVVVTNTIGLILGLLFNFYTFAADVTISVTNVTGEPVKNVVIALEPTDKSNMPLDPTPQVMDQIDTQFSPHILPVQKGANVSFPNSDSVQHHVYSFSQAKAFELKLYRDRKPQPLPFEKEGEVVLGCNIHDWMLGYVYVLDTPWFAKTGGNGNATITLPDGQYTLSLYSPLLQGSDKEIKKAVSINGTSNIKLNLTSPLLQQLMDYEKGDEFDAY